MRRANAHSYRVVVWHKGRRYTNGKAPNLATAQKIELEYRQNGRNYRLVSEGGVPQHLFRPVLLPLHGGSKAGRHQWLRGLNRIGRVRAREGSEGERLLSLWLRGADGR
jgi:hypothetical protein